MRWRLARGLVAGLVAAAGVLLFGAAVLVMAEFVVRPGPLERFRFDHINANGDGGGSIAMLWSIETYSDVVYTEGPRGLAVPSQIRLVRPDGSLGVPQPVRTLDPVVNVGVCASERPPLGTSWWSGSIPHEMAEQLRATGVTTWHFEAYVRDHWVSVVLIDSGCRGIGRG